MEQRRRGGQAGATLVEYALVLGLVVLASVGAIENLQQSTEDGYDGATSRAEALPGNGGDRVDVSPTSSTTTTTTTTTTALDGAPDDDGSTTTAPTTVLTSVEDESTSQGSRKWRATARVTTEHSDTGASIVGAAVSVRYIAANGAERSATCTTATDGSCTVTWSNREPGHSPVLVTVVEVTSTPSWDGVTISTHLFRP